MSITIPDAEIEAATSDDGMRPVLSQVDAQQIHGEWYLCATDSYVAAAVPIDDPGDSEGGMIPTSLLSRARKALVAARKQYKGYANADEADENVQLTTSGDRVRLSLKNAQLDPGVYGDLDLEAKRMLGTFPRFEQLLEAGGSTATKVSYGTVRVTFNTQMLVRLAKALGALQGRGRGAHAIVTLDLPVNEDGTVNELRAIRVQPGAVSTGGIGLLMPVRASVDQDEALKAWPKAKPARKKRSAAKKPVAKKARAKA